MTWSLAHWLLGYGFCLGAFLRLILATVPCDKIDVPNVIAAIGYVGLGIACFQASSAFARRNSQDGSQ